MTADAGITRIDSRLVPVATLAAAPVEIHPPLRLTLRLDAAAETALRRALTEILGSALSRVVTRNIERVYWDTADGAIGRNGFALALRRAGTKTWQRMLAIGERRLGGGTVQDVDAPITGARPDLVRLALQPGADPHEIGALDPETLVPVFAIEAKRMVWRAEWHGTRLVIGFESGTMRSPAGEQPVCQLVIDSESGPGATVYELTRQLWPTIKPNLAEFDEVQEGYCLALKADWWHEATKPRLDPAMSTKAGILAIGRAALAATRIEMAKLGNSTAPERVHQARVAIRRLRSLLTVFGPALPEAPRRRFAKSLGVLASALGETREWDVFLADAVGPIAQALPSETGIGSLRLAAAVLRDQAALRLPSQIAEIDFPILSLDLGSWFDAGIWPASDGVVDAERAFLLEQPLKDFARDILRKRHRRMFHTAEALNDPRPAELHDLRLHAKKLRYTAEFFAALYPAKASRPYLMALREVQEVLGHINDASVTPGLLERLKSPKRDSSYTTGVVMGWTASRAEVARGHFAAAWKELGRAKRFWRE